MYVSANSHDDEIAQRRISHNVPVVKRRVSVIWTGDHRYIVLLLACLNSDFDMARLLLSF